MLQMRRTVLTFAAALAILAGCSYKGPERTFQAKGILCSESDMTIAVSERTADLFQRFGVRVLSQMPPLPGAEASDNPTLSDLQAAMESCRQFLSDEKPSL